MDMEKRKEYYDSYLKRNSRKNDSWLDVEDLETD
jgi:hypothetical protein